MVRSLTMILFSCIALPLAYLTIASLVWEKGLDVRESAVPFGYGTVAVIPTMFVLWLVSLIFPEQYSGAALYFHVLAVRHLFPAAAVSGAVYLLYMVVLHDQRSLLFNATGLFAGCFSVITLLEWLSGVEYPGAYGAFYLPLIRIFLILSIPPLIARGFRTSGGAMIFWLSGAFLVPFISAFISFFYLSNRFTIALIMLLVLVPAAALAYFIASRND